MVFKAAALWVIGLVTFVPYGVYYLLFEATRDQYALLITSILFWVFGYWGVVGPLIAIFKVRAVFRAIEGAQSKAELVKVLQTPDAREAAIELIASDNHIPRFLAARVYKRLVSRLGTP